MRAAHWALRVNAGEMTLEDDAALDAWMEADVRNLGAFSRAMAADAFFDRAAALGVPDAAAVVDAPAPRAPEAAPEVAPEAAPSPRGGISRRAWIGGGIGALAATMVAAVGMKSLFGSESIAAPLGNIRRAGLRDGSAVTLNSSAEIEVALRDAVRRVALVAGEASFDVAKDAARPFIVDAGPIRIRVVGTSFIVRLTDAGTVSVTVREGIVDVAEVQRGDAAPTRLLAGDRLSFASRKMVREKLTMADVDRIGLWQHGEMDLTGMTLEDAAREFARYSETRIAIGDPAVARLKVAGIYSTSDPAGFARDAALAQGLRISATADVITLSR